MTKEIPSDWFKSACPPQDGVITQNDARWDWTPDLGKPLSARDINVYTYLKRQGTTYTQVSKIYQDCWGAYQETSADTASGVVGKTIQRLKKKLGEVELENKPGSGYRTRRGAIIQQVFNNFQDTLIASYLDDTLSETT